MLHVVKTCSSVVLYVFKTKSFPAGKILTAQNHSKQCDLQKLSLVKQCYSSSAVILKISCSFGAIQFFFLGGSASSAQISL